MPTNYLYNTILFLVYANVESYFFRALKFLKFITPKFSILLQRTQKKMFSTKRILNENFGWNDPYIFICLALLYKFTYI